MAKFDINEALKEAKALAKRMKKGEVYAPNGLALRYRLFSPEIEEGKKYPLVVFLHGMGERGTDNKKQVEGQYGANMWARDNVQSEYPCFIASPQCPDGRVWTDEPMQELVIQMVSELLKDDHVDPSRVYITGLSLGGMGTWKLIAGNPGVFAAAAPICGAATLDTARRIGSTPVWAFHAEDDTIVPAAAALEGFKDYYGSGLVCAEAVRRGASEVRYTEYPAPYITEKYGFGHASWIEAYDDPELIKWMFSKRKDERYTVSCVVPGVCAVDDGMDGAFYVTEGAHGALVIDTGMGRGDIISCVERITRLPYCLALTHGHGDHSMHCNRFEKVYVDFKDMYLLKGSRFAGQEDTDISRLTDISGGHDFDLGGGVVIKAVPLNGHTPGSTLFVDMFHKCVFTGDAVGSGVGVWMQVPGALKIKDYEGNIASAIASLEALGVDGGWIFLGGHPNQQYMNGFNPIGLNLMRDMEKLCRGLVSGEIKGALYEKNMMGRFGRVYTAGYGKASMLYHAEQLV